MNKDLAKPLFLTAIGYLVYVLIKGFLNEKPSWKTLALTFTILLLPFIMYRVYLSQNEKKK